VSASNPAIQSKEMGRRKIGDRSDLRRSQMPEIQPLSEAHVEQALQSLPGWVWTKDMLYKSFTFSDFVAAFSFMTKVALQAEKRDHHPNWSNVFNRVEIYLTTHDAGNKVTVRDTAMARAIEDVAKL
jgi:4a-hydroxytetrahydrobiopterin dehydratase